MIPPASVHQTFAAAATLLVVASPLVVLGLQRRSLLGPPGSMVAVGQWLIPPLAALSVAAGVVHAAVIGDHFREDVLSGTFFVVITVAQLAWAAWFLRHPSSGLAWLGLLGNAAIIGVWVVTRTIGLPFGAHPFVPEVMALPDVVATIAELLIVIGTAALIAPRAASAVRRPRYAVASADLTVVMAFIAIALVTALALSEIALHGGHAAAPV